MKQQGHPVAHAQRLPPVVGHQDRCGAKLPVQGQHQLPHVLPQVLVQGGEGLVQQQQTGSGGQSPGQGNPLPLSAGQGTHLPWSIAGQPDPLQQLCRLLQPRPPPHAPHPQGEGHVFRRRHMGEEADILKEDHYSPPVGRQAGDILPAQADAAALGGQYAGHRLQKGGLAAARGPQKGEKRPLLRLEGHASQDVPPLQGHGQPFNLQPHSLSPRLCHR